MQYILALVGILGGTTLLYFFKNLTSQALLSTLKTKEDVQKIQGDVIKTEALDSVQTEIRNDIQENLEKKQHEQLNKDEMSDFFNNLKP